MDLTKLVTLTFAKNVGTADRIARIASGVGLIGAGLYLQTPTWGSIAMVGGGLLWTATGLLSKCSIYYLLGYSTCPLSGKPAAVQKPAGRAQGEC